MQHNQSSSVDARIGQFFDTFSAASNTLDLNALAGCFADPFLSADAGGARPVPRSVFLQALPRRAQMFADAGIGTVSLTSIHSYRLDDHYLLARTEWAAPRATSRSQCATELSRKVPSSTNSYHPVNTRRP